MKHMFIGLGTGFVILLVGISCRTSPPASAPVVVAASMPAPPPPPPPVTFVRVAGSETAYDDPDESKKDANSYHAGQGNSGTPPSVQNGPRKAYSVREKPVGKGLATEARFRYPLLSGEGKKQKFDYHEIPQAGSSPTPATNNAAFKQAVQILEKQGATLLDSAGWYLPLENEKKVQRAIFRSNGPIQTSSKAEAINSVIPANTEFGIVINPPYP